MATPSRGGGGWGVGGKCTGTYSTNVLTTAGGVHMYWEDSPYLDRMGRSSHDPCKCDDSSSDFFSGAPPVSCFLEPSVCTEPGHRSTTFKPQTRHS